MTDSIDLKVSVSGEKASIASLDRILKAIDDIGRSGLETQKKLRLDQVVQNFDRTAQSAERLTVKLQGLNLAAELRAVDQAIISLSKLEKQMQATAQSQKQIQLTPQNASASIKGLSKELIDSAAASKILSKQLDQLKLDRLIDQFNRASGATGAFATQLNRMVLAQNQLQGMSNLQQMVQQTIASVASLQNQLIQLQNTPLPPIPSGRLPAPSPGGGSPSPGGSSGGGLPNPDTVRSIGDSAQYASPWVKKLMDSFVQGIGIGGGIDFFSMLSQKIAQFTSIVPQATLQFERFRATLKTLLGNDIAVKNALTEIQDFAAKTPFQLDELVSAFISLKQRGIEPTTELLTNLGDLAASQGKPIQQLIEAVLDAQQLENERLKEFGIKASVASEKITYSFRNQTFEVDRSSDDLGQAITEVIQKMGQMEGIAGGMGEQSKTLGGQLSNLEDNTSKAAVAFGTELLPPLVEILETLNQLGDAAAYASNDLGEALLPALNLLKDIVIFVVENIETLQFALEAIVATGIITFLGSTALGMEVFALATGKATLSVGLLRLQLGALQKQAMTLLPFLQTLLVVAGLLAGLKLAAYTRETARTNQELEELGKGSAIVADSNIRKTQQLKRYNDDLSKSKAGQKKLTDEQIKQAERQVQLARDEVLAADAQIAALKENMDKGNEDQKRAREAQIAGLEATKEGLQGQITQTEQLAELGEYAVTLKKDERTELEKLDQMLSDTRQKESIQMTARKTAIQESIAAGVITEKEAQVQISSLEAEELKNRLKQSEDYYRDVQALRDKMVETVIDKNTGEKAAKDPKLELEYNQKVLQAEEDLANARLAVATYNAQEINRLRDQERDRFEDIAKVSAEANEKIKRAESDRILAYKKLLAEGQVSQEQYDYAVQRSTQERIEAQIKAEQQSINRINALPPPNFADQNEVALYEERIKNRQAANDRLIELQTQLVDNEIAQQKFLADYQRKNIADFVASRKRATTQAVEGVQNEIEAYKSLEQSLGRITSLYQSREKLIQSVDSLQSSRGDRSIQEAKRAEEIIKQLSDDQRESAETRKALEAELAALGFQSNSKLVDVVEKRIKSENEQANLKINALLRQQKLEQISFDLESKRSAIAAKRAVAEAEIAELKAKQATLEAQGNLSAANLTGDKNAIAEAKLALDIAQKQQILTSQGVDLAKDAQKNDFLNTAIGQQALANQQQQQREEAGFQEKFRQLAQDREVTQFNQESDRDIRIDDRSRPNEKALLSSQGLVDQSRSLIGLINEEIQGRSDITIALNQQIAAMERLNAEQERSQRLAQDAEYALSVLQGIPAKGIEGREKGGPVETGTPYLVGERSPEIFVPTGPGAIIPGEVTSKLLSLSPSTPIDAILSSLSRGLTPPAMPNLASGGVLAELRGLRGDLAGKHFGNAIGSVPVSINNHYGQSGIEATIHQAQLDLLRSLRSIL